MKTDTPMCGVGMPLHLSHTSISRLPCGGRGGDVNCAPPPPPISLFSRERRDDSVVVLRRAWGSFYGSPEPRRPLETTRPNASPKNCYSLDYDDDGVSSSFSTPADGSPSYFRGSAKCLLLSSGLSSTSAASGHESNALSSTAGAAFTRSNSSPANCHWISNFRQGAKEGELLEEEIREEKEEEGDKNEIAEGLRTPWLGCDPNAFARQPRDIGINSRSRTECGCGVSTASTAAAAATTSPINTKADSVDLAASEDPCAWTMQNRGETYYEDDDSVLTLNSGDEVLGVTAEGEFIYRRDIDAEERRLNRTRYQHSNDNDSGYLTLNGGVCDDELSATAPAPPPGMFFCTPERNIFATVLSGRGEMAPHVHEDVHQARKNMTTMSTKTPQETSARLSQRDLIGTNKKGTSCEWTPSEVEWCSLLLKYRACENTDEMEYGELIGAIDEWHKAQRRFPIEALERRLLEKDRCGKPPFVLWW